MTEIAAFVKKVPNRFLENQQSIKVLTINKKILIKQNFVVSIPNYNFIYYYILLLTCLQNPAMEAFYSIKSYGFMWGELIHCCHGNHGVGTHVNFIEYNFISRLSLCSEWYFIKNFFFWFLFFCLHFCLILR